MPPEMSANLTNISALPVYVSSDGKVYSQLPLLEMPLLDLPELQMPWDGGNFTFTARVVAQNQDGSVNLRSNLGNIIKARIAAGVELPIGAETTLTVAGRSGNTVQLRQVVNQAPGGPTLNQLFGYGGGEQLAVNSEQSAGSPTVANALPQGAGTVLQAASGQGAAVAPDIQTAIETLQKLGLPLTNGNVAAMREIQAAPAVPLPQLANVISQLASGGGEVLIARDALPQPALIGGSAEQLQNTLNAPNAPLQPQTAANVPLEQVANVQQPAPSNAAQPNVSMAEPRTLSATEQVPLSTVPLFASLSPNAEPQTNARELKRVNANLPETLATLANNAEVLEKSGALPIKPEITVNPAKEAAIPPEVKLKAAEKLQIENEELPEKAAVREREASESAVKTAEKPEAALHAVKERIAEIRQQTVDNRAPENRFLYTQIPVIVNNQRSTAELYIYKNANQGNGAKRGKRLDPENVKILLGLDLQKAGRVESLISIRGKEVTLKFDCSKSEVVSLVRRESPELYRAISSVGFKLTNVSAAELTTQTTPQSAMTALLENAAIISKSGVGFEIYA
jgi:hypothetical protein